MNHKYANASNKYRVAGPCVVDNFGLVEINWDASPGPQVTFKAVGLDGATVFQNRVLTGLNIIARGNASGTEDHKIIKP